MPPGLRSGEKFGVSGRKIFLLGLQCCVLMIVALVVWAKVYDRESTNRRTVSELSAEFGEQVTVHGPMLRLSDMLIIAPESYEAKAKVETFYIHRNIYEAEVYTAHIRCSGSFRLPKEYINNPARVEFYMPLDQYQILNPTPLEADGHSINWEAKGTDYCATIQADQLGYEFNFSTSFDVRGSSGLFLYPTGKRSELVIEGQAKNPSFQGAQLPNRRSVKGKDFRAEWLIDKQIDRDAVEAVGADFLVGVDHYQKVSRSMKYAFLIIVLTYISVLFCEIILKHPIPLLNYFLIGAALVLFYVLLLSFVEHISFGWSYLIAAGMTIILIALYMYRMLCSLRVGLSIAVILTILYIVCFILLTLGRYALLMGSLLLFVVLALMMYGSLKLKH